MQVAEDIAIVGVGCRFPGADNLDEFWRVLSKGENHVKAVPPDRWNVDAWYAADSPGKTYATTIGAVKGHDEFDYRLYGISANEAFKMDPQQRFTLDCVAMALEDGGFTREQLKGSKTAVYMGVMNTDYGQVAGNDLELTDSYTLTGTASSIVAARVSYVFDLHGTAVSLDTACSSAMVAIHQASQAILSGDCDLALAGGVNAIMIHNTMVPLSRAKMVSRDGQCKAFSEDADGYARGEGCGVVVLKRLSDALKDKDKIWATIKTGTNQDGNMVQPISAPSDVQQRKLLHELYARYNIDTATVQYIEAHGTGTPLGDPTEAKSLGQFFADDGRTRYLGSVKTNIGHLESAAGAAGLIKVLLMMKNQTIVPSLHSSKLNRKIDFDKYHFKVPQNCVPWKELPAGGRGAGVNSFGFGGTNAHAYVRQHISKSLTQRADDNGHRIIALSSQTSEGLRANIKDLKQSLQDKTVDMDSLSFTSTCRRDHREFRLAFHANDKNELIAQIDRASLPGISHHPENLKIIYVFCGMGTAWKGMCKGLLNLKIFRGALEKVDKLLNGYKSISVIRELNKADNLHDPAIEPLVLFACQVGLMAVWRDWGVEPAAVVGQSVGEVAAAYAAGSLSLESAVHVIFHRTGILLQSVGGKMLWVKNYPIDKAEQLCAQHSGRANIAVYNSPISCTISGEDDAVASVKSAIEKEEVSDIMFKELAVKTAYHCHKQKPLAKPLTEALKGLKVNCPTVDIASTVTGTRAIDGDFALPEYWSRNMTAPVKFYQAIIDVADESKVNVFIEVGPNPVLRAHFDDILEENMGTVIPSMLKEEHDSTILNSLGKLYSLGINPNWKKITPQNVPELTSLPQYQFQRIKHLFETEKSLVERQGLGQLNSNHPYISRVSGNSPTFEIRINQKDTPFVFSHSVGRALYVPGAFFADAALAYGSETFETVPHEVFVSFRLLKPIDVKENIEKRLTILTDSQTASKACFKIMHKSSICVFGEVYLRKDFTSPLPIDIAAVRRRCDIRMKKDEIYNRLEQYGFQYGEPIQLLTKCVANSVECLSWLTVSGLVKRQMKRTHLHPSILDAIMQSTCAIYSNTNSNFTERMPARLRNVAIYSYTTEHMMCYSRLTCQTEWDTHFNILLLTRGGQVIAEVEDMMIRTLGKEVVTVYDMEFGFQWITTQLPIQEATMGHTVTMGGKNMPKEVTNELARVPMFGEIKTEGILTTDALKTFLTKPYFALQSRKGEISGIVYFQFFSQNPGGSAAEVLDDITESFGDLKELLSFLSEEDINTPLTVVTYKTQITQNIPGDLEIKLDGAHIWGMVRCFVRESNTRVQLIDLGDFNIPTLETVVQCVDIFKSEMSQLKEMLICKGKAYKSSLRSTRRLAPNLHRLANQEGVYGPLSLVSQANTSLEKCDFHLEYPSEEQKITPSKKTVTINVTTFVITSEEMLSDRHSNNAQTEDRITCIEALGCPNNDPKKEVIVVVPPIPATVLSIDADCTLPKSLIQNYKPGLLTCFIVVEKVAICVTRKSHITVVSEKEKCPFSRLLAAIQSYMGYKDIDIRVSSHKEDIRPVTECLIFLSKFPMDTIHSWKHNIQQIIAVTGFSGGLELMKAYMTKGEVCCQVIAPWDIFQISQVPRALQHISKMLSKEKEKFNEILSTFEKTDISIFVSNVVYMARRTKLPLYLTEKTLFRKDSAYIVIGGLTGLGWLLVRYIAERKGCLVAIMSRRNLDSDLKENVENLRCQTGSDIIFLQANVCEKASLENAFRKLQANYPNKPVRGIFHGAGVLKDSLLVNSSLETFKQVSSPKIMGSINLHQISVEMNLQLDYFILHSSIVSIFGNAGQTCYAAANSFLDSFTNYRRQKKLPCQAINWGPLAVGMAVSSEDIEKSWKSAGFQKIEEREINDCLTQALLTNNSSACFVNINRLKTNINPIEAEDIRNDLDGSGWNRNTNRVLNLDIDVPALQAMDVPQRRETLWSYVTRLAEQTFPISMESFLESTIISSLGITSLSAFGLSNQIKRDTGVSIPATKLISQELTMGNLLLEVDAGLMNRGGHMNEVIQQNDAYVHEIFPHDISPMQELIYRNYRENYNNNDVLQVTELPLPIALSVGGLKSILNKLIQRHKTLRTIYKMTKRGILSEVLDEFALPEIVVLKSDNMENVKIEIQQMFNKPFELNSELAFRVALNPSVQPTCIWFIFHPITFDQTAINIFFKDFKSLAMNEEMAPTNDIDIPGEVFKVLNPRFQELKVFWSSRFNETTSVSLLSLSESEQIDYKPSGLEENVEREIDGDLIRKVLETCRELNITMFHFLVSTNQLLWYLLTGENSISLLIDIDTRLHVPALNDVITHCSNYLPVRGIFNERSTIQSCLKGISTEVKECVDHGLYPGFCVFENLSEISAANACRHNIVMEDLTGQHNLEDHLGNKVGKAGPMGIHHETRLLLWANERKNMLKMQLDYHPGIVTKKAAELFLCDLEALMGFLATNCSINIEIGNIPRSLIKSSSRRLALPPFTGVPLQMSSSMKPFSEIAPSNDQPDLPPPYSPVHGETSLRMSSIGAIGVLEFVPQGQTNQTDTSAMNPSNADQSYSQEPSSSNLAEPPRVLPSSHTKRMAWPDLDQSSLSKGSWFVMKTGFCCCLSTSTDVFLKVSFTDGKPDYLEWGIEEDCPRERINIAEIKKVNLLSAGGRPTLKIKTKTTTMLMTGNQTEAAAWSRALTEMIDSREKPGCYDNPGTSFEEEAV